MNFLNELKTSILIRLNIPWVSQMGPTNVMPDLCIDALELTVLDDRSVAKMLLSE